MKIATYRTLATILAFAILICMPIGCGSSGGDGPTVETLPRYPNATEGASMEKSAAAGMMKGSLAQFTTTDPFEEVVDFYTDALSKYNPQVISNKSDLGRQTALSIPQKKGVISVAIQEFVAQGKVNITFMAVGS